jgi:hypothetical protein
MRAGLVVVVVFAVGCSSAKQQPPPPQNADEANVRPIDAAVAVDAAIDASVDAGGPVDAPAPPPVVKAKPKQPKRNPCPACGIGCPRGTPSSKVDKNGCPVCRCEDFAPIAPDQSR